MGKKFFSSKHRPVHLGAYPLETLKRLPALGALDHITPYREVSFARPDDPQSIVNAMGEFQAMMDAIRDGFVARTASDIPDDLTERSAHMKAFGYFNDMAMVGIGPFPDSARLSVPRRNPEIARLSQALQTRQTKTLAAGIDMIMADLKESMAAAPKPMGDHHTALVFLVDHKRDPKPGELGCDWVQNAQDQRATVLSTETATIIANYIRLLGYDARAHTATTTEVDLAQLAVASGLGVADADGDVHVPWLGQRFGLAAVTTTMDLAHDLPLAPLDQQVLQSLTWRFGTHGGASRSTRDPYAKRDYHLGAHKFETLKRVETPTTYIDEPNVARVPKRADLFARAQFGDMGKHVQKDATGGKYVRKSAPSSAQRRVLGAFVLLQDGERATSQVLMDPDIAAANIKGASYFLSVDAVGLSRCPDWAWYSHDATGAEITPPHDQAISMIIDQGFETMEGASGDDWISVAQSMRAYLRFSLLGGIIAQHIRNLGYKARAHTVLDGEVLQPPLLLLSGLGEVSRIGEVILNPFLGPRLKSGAVTTDLPMAHDKPIDFGMQKFCENCNKCARECPSGAITAGPKLMFNGYEIWKSDSQKCATYRITTPGGAMCGRCMKTCPWNLEGLFAEAPFRWAAMNLPAAAPIFAKLDDAMGKGGLNDTKKWWWDLELTEGGDHYAPTQHPLNRRDLQKDLKLDYADQTLAVYPAPLAPAPYPYPAPMDREAGIAAYQAMVPASEHRAKSAAGETAHLHKYTHDPDAPVVAVTVAEAQPLAGDVMRYVLTSQDGRDLPQWRAGAHLDIVVAPEYLRPYSMCGDPADRTRYEVAVLREDTGRGGSLLMHRIFAKGRRVFISKPINHFALDHSASHSLFFGGGIGVTPMVAFAHEAHQMGLPFELHYSASTREDASFDPLLAQQNWAKHVTCHYSNQGTRLNLTRDMPAYTDGTHLYVCGPDAYMQAVLEAARSNGFPDSALHFEYFSTPEVPDYENHAFQLVLKDGREIAVSADQSAAEALNAAGVHVDVKCDDGLCGVCKCGIVSGKVEHRDFVLSQNQQATHMILCQSRAAAGEDRLVLDL